MTDATIELTSFATFNQFDKRFTDFEKFGADRTACPLFGLLTAYNFMMNGDISKNQHEKNICASILNYMTKPVPKYMLFDELLLFTNSLTPDKIGATSPELISQNILGYDNIFKPVDYNQNYCVVFLKNRNYINVLVKYEIINTESNSSNAVNYKITYSVRDCHENHQHNFNNFNQLRNFLNNTYQFEQMTVAGGLAIPEFSNIEFLVIDAPFALVNIDADLYDENIVNNDAYEDKNNQKNDVSIQLDLDQEMALAMQMENEEDYLQYI
jgi:hypothetical protein